MGLISNALMRCTWCGVVLFLLAAPGGARQAEKSCGTYPEKRQEELALHRRSRWHQALKPAALRQSNGPAAVRDIGHIVVLEDRDGVVSRRNAFNLDRRSIRFLPGDNATYRIETGDSAYDADAASNSTPLAGLGDDDSREVALPFAFPFFGRTHSRVFVNSDGNLTFEAPDTSVAERSLGRVTSGPPRIAPFFADLDPSRAPSSVRVLLQTSRVVVSWVATPQYSSFGAGPQNTFQVVLLPNGLIQFSYSGIGSSSAVVGIAPGRLTGGSSVISFVTPTSRQFSGAVVERFTNVQEVDIVFAAQKFYEAHEDAYDYLVIYNNLDIDAASGAIAYEVTVRSQQLGIGDTPTDTGREFGSASRLQAVLNLGPLSQYPRDPFGIVPGRSISRDTPLSILGHEAGHLWLAFASVREPANPEARPMLGRQTAHWAFNFNSEASLLEGNRIIDNGPEARPRFRTVATVEGFSPLDQYLMGLRAPSEVPPTFLVANPTLSTLARPPQSGISFDGVRRDIHIDELIRAEGRRTPDHTVSQRRFRFAFILVTGAGTQPSSEQLSQLDSYRREFERYFEQVTNGRAQADTSLTRKVQLSLAPAAGVLAGGVTEATLQLSGPAESSLTFEISTTGAFAEAPATVTIPAGQDGTRFTVRGLRAGVEEIQVLPRDTRYAPAVARVQVLPALSALRLAPVAGDKQRLSPTGTIGGAIVARVTDRNNLPYANITVNAASLGGGTVEPALAVSDATGHVQFLWRPGHSSARLRLAVNGAPDVELFFTTSPGRPSIRPDGVVNAASFNYGLTPAGLATILGNNLAGGAMPAVAASLPLPTELAGVRVLVNAQPVRLLYVSDQQINFLMPVSVAGNNVAVQVELVSDQVMDRSEPAIVPVRFNDPGIFFNPSNNIAAALVAGTALTTDLRPVAPGEILEVYCTGLGAVVAAATPGLAETARKPLASLGGLDAEVLFSGLAPGFPGLYQVNVRVPASLPPGPQLLTLRIDSNVSNETRVIVR